MADLQVTQEVIVLLNSFHNVDLFQRGYYQVRCRVETPSKLTSIVECELKEETPGSKLIPCLFKNFVDKYTNTGISKTIEVYYKHEEVTIKDAFVFKVHMLVDASKMESQIPMKLQLVLELYFAESSRSPATPKSLEHVSTQTLNLHFTFGDSYHAYRPVLFDYFHLGAINITIHSCIVALRQPWSATLKALHPMWNGKSGNIRQYTYTALFGKAGNIQVSQQLEPAHKRNASYMHRVLCLQLLKFYENLLTYYHSLISLLPDYAQMRLSKVDIDAKLEVLNSELHALNTAEEVYLRVGDDLYLLSTELGMLWMQFSEQFIYEEALVKRLIKDHHRLRMEHMKEAVFTQEHPWAALCTSLELSTSQQLRMFSNIKSSLYYQLVPPIHLECSVLDGDSTTMPIIFEDKYVPGMKADKETNGDILTVEESIVGDDFVDMDISIEDSSGRVTRLSVSDINPLLPDSNTKLPHNEHHANGSATKHEHREIFKNGTTLQAWELSKEKIKSLTKETDLTGPDYCSASFSPTDVNDEESEFSNTYICDSKPFLDSTASETSIDSTESLKESEKTSKTSIDNSESSKESEKTSKTSIDNSESSKEREKTSKTSIDNSECSTPSDKTSKTSIDSSDSSKPSEKKSKTSIDSLKSSEKDSKTSINTPDSSKPVEITSKTSKASEILTCLSNKYVENENESETNDNTVLLEEDLFIEDLELIDSTGKKKKTITLPNKDITYVENVIGGIPAPIRPPRPKLWSCLPAKGNANRSPYKVAIIPPEPYLLMPKKLSTRFECAKENLEVNADTPGYKYRIMTENISLKPYFTERILATTENVHLVVCVHGLDGNSGDLRLVRCFLEIALPRGNFEFLMSEVNQEDTFCDIDEMTQRLVNEILEYIEEQSLDVVRLSFVGHSLGNIIIRNAVAHSSLFLFRNKLHTFLSLSGPHLGMQFHTSNLVSTGMWLMQKWKKCGSLVQLALNDSSDPRDTFMYRLSLTNGFQYFKNVLLVSSVQDHYVPFHSARVEMSKHVVKDNTEVGRVYKEMLDNIMNPLMAQEEVNIVKFSVYHPMTSSPNTFIGRAAHIAMLDSELFLEKFILVIAYKYFQ